MKKALLITLITIVWSVPSHCQSQSSLTEHSCMEHDVEYKKMMETYRKIISKNTDNETFVYIFAKAQDIWELFIETHLDAIYPPVKGIGSLDAMNRSNEYRRLIMLRHDQLKEWLKVYKSDGERMPYGTRGVTR